MPVYRRKDTKSHRYYYKFSLDGETYKKNIPTARTRRQAEQAEMRAREEIHAGIYGTRRAMLLADFVQQHYLPWAKEHHKHHSQDVTAGTILCNHFNGFLLGQLSPLAVEGLKLALLKTKTRFGRCYAASTVNLYLSYLSRMLNKAVDWAFITSNPCRKVKSLRLERKRPRCLLPEEEETLMAALTLTAPHLANVAQLGLLTGFRVSEIINLQKSDVDFNRRLAFVGLPKCPGDLRKTEGVPLSKEAVELLARVCAESPITFVFHQDGKPLRLSQVEHGFSKAVDLAGLKGLTFHKLRHTFGTRLGDLDINLKKIARLLGHATTRYTEIYVHPTDSGLREAVDRVAQYGAEFQNRTGCDVAKRSGVA